MSAFDRAFVRRCLGLAYEQGDLTSRERDALAAIDTTKLDRYRRSLVEKRAREFCKVVPLSLRVAPRVRAIYCAFLEDTPATRSDFVLAPGVAEGLRALPALRAQLANEQYVPDLLAFEVCAAASRLDGRYRRLSSRWPIEIIAREVKSGVIPVDPEQAPCEFQFAADGVKKR